MSVKELYEKRAAVYAQSEEFATRRKAGESLSAEDNAAWERAMDDFDTITAEIKTVERSEKISSSFKEIDEQRAEALGNGASKDDPGAEYRDIFQRWVRRGPEGLTPEQRAIMAANFNAPDERAQSEGTGSEGGYTVEQGFWRKITEVMKLYGGAEIGAEVIRTSTGATLPWPTNDDTGNTGEQLGENAQAADGDLTFGQKSLGNYTYSSKVVKVSLQLLQDTGVDLEGFLARKLGERIGRIENTRFTTGTGSSQPQGYITGASTGKTTASATAITYDEIIDLIHSVDPAYRASGRCRFKMNDLVLAYLRKVRDESGGAGYGRPLWQPSVQAGIPDTINGYAYDVNNDMDSAVTATKKTIAFGDFTAGFVVRHVNGGQMLRLTERYADYLQVGFLAFDRADSVVQDASAFKLLVQHS